MNLQFQFLILFVLSYFLGGIPTGKWIAARKGVDIQQVGSRNIGAANVNRALGLRLAAAVLALDAAKGFIPTIIAKGVFQTEWMICCVALAACLGHIFSPFLKFKGGKGVSTYFGVLLSLIPFPTIFGFLIWMVAVRAVKITSIINLAAFLLVVPMLYYFTNIYYAAFGICIWGILIYTHKDNIKRLLRGDELKVYGRTHASNE